MLVHCLWHAGVTFKPEPPGENSFVRVVIVQVLFALPWGVLLAWP
jgi:hypothetical protein